MKKFLLLAFGLIVMMIGASTIDTSAQVKDLVNPLGTSAVPILSDTVTNAATNFLTSPAMPNKAPQKAQETIISVVCTEISGTTAGTITIQGSLDGTNFKAIPTEETQTSVTTATALDVASQVFVWRIKGNPFLYYRVSWTGSGTMADSFSAKIVSH